MTETYRDYRESDPTKDPRIAAELAEGEELVWAGRPLHWRLVRNELLSITIFAALWTGMSLLILWASFVTAE